MHQEVFFHTCNRGASWADRALFLADPVIRANGYVADFETPESGLFLFTHDHAQCKTTFSIQAAHFLDLYKGASYEQKLTGTAACAQYCLHQTELRECGAACEYASIRKILSVIRGWPKELMTH